MAAEVLANTAGAAWGVKVSETGLLVAGTTNDWENPKNYLLDESGSEVGFAHNITQRQRISISGAVNGTGGLMATAISFGVDQAATLAIDAAGEAGEDRAGMTAGVIMLDSINISEDSSDWKRATLNFLRIKSLTALN